MRAVWIVLICLGALALILLLASYIVMRYACRRGHALGTDLDKELRHSSFRHYKDDIVRAQQWLKEQPVQEVFVTSYDGLRLRARYIPCENARATLLLFHGWRSYPELDFGAALTFYQSFGVNILLPDERAQGESASGSGTTCTHGCSGAPNAAGRRFRCCWAACPWVRPRCSWPAANPLPGMCAA